MSLTHQEQLIALFAGELCEGEWLSQPCYSVTLAVEIARNCDPGSETSLRKAIFGEARPVDTISESALVAVAEAYARWKKVRHVRR